MMTRSIRYRPVSGENHQHICELKRQNERLGSRIAAIELHTGQPGSADV
jgi:hypothetical protein